MKSKPNGYWTKERCQEESLKYNTRTEYKTNNGSSYRKALKKGWLDEICEHMGYIRHPNNFFTKKKIKIKSKLCKCKTEFHNKYPKEYDSAQRNGWLDDEELFGHMLKMGKIEVFMFFCFII